ncbi:MAG: sulfite exporter TauE/SafE family protein [Alphaproteobacteria bacterium]|nr:sulfite exporter TauE/SafE family protein [Alphaproteobacteria bacterium]
MFALAVIAGLATGLVLGLLGSGGAIITVPALIYLLGVEPKPAIAMSLGIIAVTAGISLVTHWRRGNVNPEVAAVFAVFSSMGTYLGARIGLLMPASLQLALFAVVMLAAAWRMLRPEGAAPTGETGDTAKAVTPARIARIALPGFLVGGLAGMVGVGGGFLIVPALVLLSGLPMKRAVGTSLAIVTANSLAGFAGYAGDIAIDYPLMATFTAIAVAGSFAGTAASRHVSAPVLKKGFAGLLVVVAVYIIAREI